MRRSLASSAEDEDDVEARCLLAFSLFIGSGSIAADHGGRRRGMLLERALEQLAS